MKRMLLYFLAGVLGVVSALAAASSYELIQVADRGMEPLYQKGAMVLVERYTDGEILPLASSRNLQRGDVVLMENPIFQESGEGMKMLKRIVGVPGDKIAIKDGAVYVNGMVADEDTDARGDIRTNLQEQEIPQNCYFVLGDNRGESTDSRDEAIGVVEEDKIQGKVIEIWEKDRKKW